MLDEANAGYEEAIRLCPRDPWPHYFQGLLLLDKKENDKAENAFFSPMKMQNTINHYSLEATSPLLTVIQTMPQSTFYFQYWKN